MSSRFRPYFFGKIDRFIYRARDVNNYSYQHGKLNIINPVSKVRLFTKESKHVIIKPKQYSNIKLRTKRRNGHLSVGQFDHKPSKLQIRLPRQKEASAQKNVEPEEKFSMGSLEETYINDQNMEHLQKDYDDKLFRIN